MDVDLAPADIAQYALIGRGMPTHVMIFGIAIHGDSDRDFRQFRPLFRDGITPLVTIMV